MTFPTINDAIDPLIAALSEPGGSAVLSAPPGTGKTTIVPLALRDEAWLDGGRIVMLEPRRLATRAAARRMAWLIGEDVGETVGYRTRDERRVGPRTRIEVVTEGILTRRLQQDPSLPGTALVIFDEVHERNLPTDLGLALALDARRHLRPDLRVLAMSATIDSGRLAAMLGRDGVESAVIEAGGAPHPVSTHWFPRGPKDKLEPAVVNALTVALRREAGDALVFLPGAGEINRVARLLDDAGLPAQGIDVHPLYGMLPAAEQDAALQPSPHGRRRVVLATDIAETSLTVEGVRIVVDAGQRRAPSFDPRTGLTRLRTVAVSKASAEQRSGRAGRQGPGVVYRLWSKGEHSAKRAHDEPEIRQVDLAGLVLELAVWGTPADELPFLDPPTPRAIADGRALLQFLGALDDDGRPTALGRTMNTLPLQPRLARMVAEGDGDDERLALACCLAALLEERDVFRGRPDDRPAELGERLRLLADPRRDHPDADGRAIAGARRRADELGRRCGLGSDATRLIDERVIERAGAVLASGYPDRVALARSQPGRFQLRTGTGVWVPKEDALAGAEALVVAELDGDKREARIRMAAPLDHEQLSELFEGALSERRSVEWERGRDELVEKVERRLGDVVLDQFTRKPEPGPEVTELLLQRAREQGMRATGWSPAAASLARRVEFLHRTIGEPWPDWSEEALLASLEEWLGPFLLFAQSRKDLEHVDVAAALGARLDHRTRTELDRLAPERWTMPKGRSVPIDYEGDTPVIAAKVQEWFGCTTHPVIAGGRVTVLLHLLSPAGRPVQITGDLAGFWRGSWAEVRKEMAGRYPKHSWPVDPTSAEPR